MLARLLIAVAVFVVVGLVLVYLLGPLLVALGIPLVAILGHFFIQWGWVLAFAAAVWHYFGAESWWPWPVTRR